MSTLLDSQCQSILNRATIVSMTLKQQLKLYLELRNITAAELSRRSGVSKQTISLWLSGSNPKNLEHLKKVAAVLDTTIDHLCFGVGSDKAKNVISIDELIEDRWISGLFEIQLRKIKR